MLGIRAGDPLEAEIEDGRIVLTPSKGRVYALEIIEDPVTGLPVLSAGPGAHPVMYLLDVNALIALGLAQHALHTRVTKWLQAEAFPPLATCSITELGFVRVLAQSPLYSSSVGTARTLLLRLKQSADLRLTLLPDGQDISHLPAWAKTPNQTADGHLAALARAHDAVLATLDEKIPDAYLIP